MSCKYEAIIHYILHGMHENRKYKNENKLIQKLKIDRLIEKPVMETNVENSNPALEEYINTVKNLKGYLVDINKRYDKLEKDSSTSEEFEAVKKEYYSAIIKLKTLPKEVFSPRTCVICFDAEIEYFLNPCGHTICGSCKDKYRTNKCHICRKPNIEYRKLFL
jgi:hypothetical protein